MLSETKIAGLVREWKGLAEELGSNDRAAVWGVLERRMAAIEETLKREDIDPSQWREGKVWRDPSAEELAWMKRLGEEIAAHTPERNGARPEQEPGEARSSGQIIDEELELKESLVQAVCVLCRKSFETKNYSIFGKALSARICEGCSEKIEAEKAARVEAGKERERARLALSREEAWERFCPKEFRLVTEGGGKTELARLELEQPLCKQVLAWTGPRGLVIRGRTGTLKTRVVWRLVRRLWVEGKRVKVLTSGQFSRQCRDAGGNFTLTQWFDALAGCDLLVLDDLGKEPWSDATEGNWFDVVDERSRHDRPIIITTNDTGKTLAARMSAERAEACIRRLMEFCDQLVFQ